jgi:hypothetical protein
MENRTISKIKGYWAKLLSFFRLPKKKPIYKKGWLKRLVSRLKLGGRVSRLHLLEATERFLTLERMVESLEDELSQDKKKRGALKICREILEDARVAR